MMFLPYRDDNPPHRLPLLSYSIIGLCVLVFLYQAGLPEGELMRFVTSYGFQPAAFFGDADKDFSPTLALITCMFLHGDFMHLAGNMLYLWIFADNVECAMGKIRFAAFYVLTGVVAALTHGALEPSSAIPMVGASGAISGVLGAYLLLYPKANVKVLFGFYLYWRVLHIPAWIVLGGWFALQFFGAANAPAGEAGVAFWAHIGGFVAGLVCVKLFLRSDEHLLHARQHSPWQIAPPPLRGMHLKGRGPLRRRH